MRAILLAAFVATLFSARVEAQPIYPNLTMITAEPGVTLGRTDYQGNRFGLFGRTVFEYYLPYDWPFIFGARVPFGYGFVAGDDGAMAPNEFNTEIMYYGAQASMLIPLSDMHAIYVSGGAGQINFDPRYVNGDPLPDNASGYYQKASGFYAFEGGWRWALSDVIAIGINVGYNITTDDWIDDYKNWSDNDEFLTGAITFSLLFPGGYVEDADRDGVRDGDDMCPNTPEGVEVDRDGCPLDTDNDGVPDHKDACPGTPANTPVNPSGCPKDEDGDGVPDYIDRCPGTPAGAPVNEQGCPLDSDGDGAPDYLDKCPNTPVGAPVDQFGCPTDGDNDGVPDFKDECPNTYPGMGVDERGCEHGVGAATQYIYMPGDTVYRTEDGRTVEGGGLPVTQTTRSVSGEIGMPERMEDRRKSGRYNYPAEEFVAPDILSDGKLYTIQLSSWLVEEKARRVAQTYRDKGVDAFVIRAFVHKFGAEFYRVRVGFFDTEEDAQRYRDRL